MNGSFGNEIQPVFLKNLIFLLRINFFYVFRLFWCADFKKIKKTSFWCISKRKAFWTATTIPNISENDVFDNVVQPVF